MTGKLWLAALLLSTLILAQERSLRISFVPPPLDGTISLGIYNQFDQLVRVLHEEAPLDEFTVGPDALMTKWDGKDDYGYDLPPGKYSARGFLVGKMKIDEITSAQPFTGSTQATVRLVANPLLKNGRPSVDLTIGIDDEDILLKTTDGLPLVTIAQISDVKGTALSLDNERNAATVVVRSATGVRQFTITGISKMMAFDCGEFELK